MDISFEVLHAIPGRVRLRVPDIKHNDFLADAFAKRLMQKPGVTEVRVNRACASVVVSYDTSVLRTFMPERQLQGIKVKSIDGQAHIEHKNGRNGHKSDRLQTVIRWARALMIPTAALGASLAARLLPIAPVYALVAAATAPVFRRAISTVRKEKRLGVDFLDATAIAIMGLQRNIPTCAFMAWLISIGEHIREETAQRSQKAIAELLEFHSSTATILRGRKRLKVPVDTLLPGDKVVVNAGDLIPIDGVVVSGRAGVDQRSLTGESALQESSAGDSVYAGSIAIDGELVINTHEVGLNTRAGRIVQILRSTPAQETKIEDHAAKFADRLVAPTFAMSGIILALGRGLSRALSVLIVDFGTGVRVAAPTAFLSFMAYAAQRNIVIKGGRAMEKLASVDTVVFDKTGTLTTGLPEVTGVVPIDSRYTAKGILRLAAAAETGLNHPVASAIVTKARELKVRLPNRVEARLMVGLGVKAIVEGKRVSVGSSRMMEEEGIDTSPATLVTAGLNNGLNSTLCVTVNGKLIGVIAYADKVRIESADVVSRLKSMGIREVIMLTGDREGVARVTSAALGIDRYVAEVFPEKKLEIVRELKKNGRTVAVVGDGINDSLALAHADVAIAPAEATDAAKEASDVLLMASDLGLLVEAVAISKAATQLVKQNYGIVAFPNAAAIALAAGGLLGPAGATFINNGSTVVAGLNGLRPLLRGRKNGHKRTSHSTATAKVVR